MNQNYIHPFLSGVMPPGVMSYGSGCSIYKWCNTIENWGTGGLEDSLTFCANP